MGTGLARQRLRRHERKPRRRFGAFMPSGYSCPV